MTESKAKEILDFLAKKLGYDEFVLNGTYNKICVVKKVNFSIIRFDIRAWIFPNNWHDFEPVSSYAECLKMLLAAAKKGYSIATHYDVNNFIEPFTTLEELLIAYDLETGFSTI